jgi:hypothetical protein
MIEKYSIKHSLNLEISMKEIMKLRYKKLDK